MSDLPHLILFLNMRLIDKLPCHTSDSSVAYNTIRYFQGGFYVFLTSIPIAALSSLPFELSQKEKLILQIQRMPSEKKSALLQNLLLPYDLSYLPLHDLFTYREDAWLPKTCRRPADTAIRDVLFRMLFWSTLTITKNMSDQVEKGQYGIYLAERSDYIVLTTLSLPKTELQPDFLV